MAGAYQGTGRRFQTFQTIQTVFFAPAAEIRGPFQTIQTIQTLFFRPGSEMSSPFLQRDPTDILTP